jgi:hypothetical protein
MTAYNTPEEIDAVANAVVPKLTPEQVLMDQLLGPERDITIRCSPAVLQQVLLLLPANAKPTDVTDTDGEDKILHIRLRGWKWPTDQAKLLVSDDNLSRVASLVPVF